MIANTATPALRLETQPIPQTMKELAKYLGIEVAEGQGPAEAIVALHLAIKAERDDLKEKLKEHRALQDSDARSIVVSASRESDAKIVQQLIGPTDNNVSI